MAGASERATDIILFRRYLFYRVYAAAYMITLIYR